MTYYSSCYTFVGLLIITKKIYNNYSNVKKGIFILTSAICSKNQDFLQIWYEDTVEKRECVYY